ncbi:hypothetical protein PQX77_009696 [Marasmius sp. AFHP31]|nr:hypothetical protein PQX77_009696 [Marasmius sp. AFHP31]
MSLRQGRSDWTEITIARRYLSGTPIRAVSTAGPDSPTKMWVPAGPRFAQSEYIAPKVPDLREQTQDGANTFPGNFSPLFPPPRNIPRPLPGPKDCWIDPGNQEIGQEKVIELSRTQYKTKGEWRRTVEHYRKIKEVTSMAYHSTSSPSNTTIDYNARLKLSNPLVSYSPTTPHADLSIPNTNRPDSSSAFRYYDDRFLYCCSTGVCHYAPYTPPTVPVPVYTAKRADVSARSQPKPLFTNVPLDEVRRSSVLAVTSTRTPRRTSARPWHWSDFSAVERWFGDTLSHLTFPKVDERGYIYCFRIEGRADSPLTDFYKVGRSIDVARREGEWRRQCPSQNQTWFEPVEVDFCHQTGK